MMIEKKEKENKNTKYPEKNKLPSPGKYYFPVLVFFAVFTVFILPVLAYEAAFFHRIYPKIVICRYPVSGKTQNEAETEIIKLVNENFAQIITLKNQGKPYFISLKSLKYDTEKTVRNAYFTGRQKNLRENFKTKLNLAKTALNIPLSYTVDGTEIDKRLGDIAESLYSPVINPEIRVVNTKEKTVEVEKGKNGQNVDMIILKKDVLDFLSCPVKNAAIEIPVSVHQPEISDEIAQSTKNRATAILNKEIKLRYGENSWTITDEQLINFLSFNGKYDQAKILTYSKNFADTFNTPPENAFFNFENGKVILFKPAKDGFTLNEKELVNLIEIKLSQVEETKKNQEIQLPVNKTPPKINNGDVNSLGIRELLGKGTSNYRGSISERIHNLTLSTVKLNGVLVPPSEEFSFNASLGEVSANTGYKRAYVIKEGKTVLDDGGGVCQVSTTLFRALLNSGLPITERHAHAYRVSYYENDMGPGFDATVFASWADLKFKNNTPSYLLIQSSIDSKKSIITFEIYGTNDGRTVEISKTKTYDRQPPPPDRYQDDPTLPLGTIKQIEHSIWGAKTIFEYKVTKGNEVIEQKTFSSNYQPWQGVYLRGTKI